MTKLMSVNCPSITAAESTLLFLTNSSRHCSADFPADPSPADPLGTKKRMPWSTSRSSCSWRFSSFPMEVTRLSSAVSTSIKSRSPEVRRSESSFNSRSAHDQPFMAGQNSTSLILKQFRRCSLIFCKFAISKSAKRTVSLALNRSFRRPWPPPQEECHSADWRSLPSHWCWLDPSGPLTHFQPSCFSPSRNAPIPAFPTYLTDSTVSSRGDMAWPAAMYKGLWGDWFPVSIVCFGTTQPMSLPSRVQCRQTWGTDCRHWGELIVAHAFPVKGLWIKLRRAEISKWSQMNKQFGKVKIALSAVTWPGLDMLGLGWHAITLRLRC